MTQAGGLQPYTGTAKSVVVYNTYANNRKIHFDVFIPTKAKNPTEVANEVDKQAVEHAKEFLKLIGKPSDNLEVNICYRCHIDNTDLYEGQLWKLPDKEILIWPMEGCPKPSS